MLLLQWKHKPKLAVYAPSQDEILESKDKCHVSTPTIYLYILSWGARATKWRLPSLAWYFPSKFLPLKLLTALLWHESMLFPQAQVWKRNCWPRRAKKREWEGAKVCQQHQSTYFRFCGADQLQVFWPAGVWMFTPCRKGGNIFGAEWSVGFRAMGTITNPRGKSPQSCVCGNLVSINSSLKFTVTGPGL